MIGAFDPGRDRDPEVVSRGPGLAVQDVFLEQAEERLHRGVVPTRSNAAHRSGEP